ncbi:MAG TPA: tripartite tricarboxylate transporter substrate binding protein [Burkholderiales bacterium]|nr:tripartite tricarboxylate transporter substrate binding protein [Burkholderiales bacterium]
MRLLVASFAAMLGIAVCAHAQEYPAKPVRIIVPLAPGGLGDQLSRVVAQKLGPATKQPVIVENRTGGGGIIGAEAAAKAAPDGYTLFTGLHNTQAILPHLYARLPYDPVKDFTPVILMATVPNVLVVHPSLPVKSVKELVALARTKRGDLTYASQGVGSSGHIAAELFKLTAKVDIVHVPYKGAAPALQDLMGGHVMMMFDITVFALPNMRAGKVRALAVATAERLAVAPELPTMAEAGMPEVQGGAWFALFAPAGTPRPVIDWWNREARRALSEPDARDRFVSQGAALPLGTPENLAAFVTADSQRWGRVIRSAGIKLE